jgi:hypothetical protein
LEGTNDGIQQIIDPIVCYMSFRVNKNDDFQWLALTAYLEAIRPAVPGRAQTCKTQVMQGGRGGGGVACARGGGGRAPAAKDEREVREVATVQGGAKTGVRGWQVWCKERVRNNSRNWNWI